MPDIIAQVTIKAGGVYYPPGSIVAIEGADEARKLVGRGDAEWAGSHEEAPGPLEGFPGAAALRAAGITTVEAVPRGLDELVALDGIGRATAKKILAALEE